MKKIELFGIGNQDDFNYYVFEKNQDAVVRIIKLISEIFNVRISLSEEKEDSEGLPVSVERNFEELVDFHEGCAGKNRIDLFFGQKKVYLTIRCSLELREKFNSRLCEISEMEGGN